MKTLLPLIFAFLFCFPTSQAQYFARKDSKWVYLDYGWSFDNYVEISYTRDTVFEGRSCMEFNGKYISIDK